jgi:hypothetical protein
MITAPEPALYWTIFAIFASLVIGSIVRFIALRNAEEKKRPQTCPWRIPIMSTNRPYFIDL